MIRTIRLLAACLLACQMAATAQIHTPKKVMDDFMDLRFGMFIHWGPVTLKGTEIGWSRGKEVPVKVYDNLYRRFDPVSFDADAWVKTAKDAGMKYLVITAKHHDGFCLWPSAYTDYDIAHTPFKKDVVGALAKAAIQKEINVQRHKEICGLSKNIFRAVRIGIGMEGSSFCACYPQGKNFLKIITLN